MDVSTADLQNEAIVVACAVASARGAELAHARLQPEDISSHSLSQIFAATRDLAEHHTPTETEALQWAICRVAGDPAPDIWPSDRRLHDIAARVHVPVGDLHELIARRPVHADETGRYARRVREASRRRQLQSAAVELLLTLEEPDVDPAIPQRLLDRIAGQLQETC